MGTAGIAGGVGGEDIIGGVRGIAGVVGVNGIAARGECGAACAVNTIPTKINPKTNAKINSRFISSSRRISNYSNNCDFLILKS